MKYFIGFLSLAILVVSSSWVSAQTPVEKLVDEIVDKPEEVSLLVLRITKEIKGPFGGIAEKAKAGKRLSTSEKMFLSDLAILYRAKPQRSRMGNRSYQLHLVRHIISVQKAILDLHHGYLASRIKSSGLVKKSPQTDSLEKIDEIRRKEVERLSEMLGAYLKTLAPKKRKPT